MPPCTVPSPRSGNGGGGGGSFLSYLQEQTGPGWIPVTDPTQAWVGTQPKPRQAVDSVMSAVRDVRDGDPVRLSQEALLQPVRDMGHSEILRGHFRGTQPFEKGLGFPHRVPDLRTWDDVRLRGQVRATAPRGSGQQSFDGCGNVCMSVMTPIALRPSLKEGSPSLCSFSR